MPKLNVRSWLLAGVASTLVCGAPAFAADLPVKAPPMAAPVVYNWTGIYGGLHVGYGKGMKDWTDATFDYDVKGFLGGGQLGVNQQIGNWVVGAEIDASWANIKGDQTFTVGGAAFGFTQTASVSTKVDRLVTAGLRLGFAQDRWLVYLKGGAAWAHENHSFDAALISAPPGGPITTQTLSASAGENRYGAMLGIGSEVALWGNWSLKSEYNYIRFEPRVVRLAGTLSVNGAAQPITFSAGIAQNIHLAKLGVNYRFGPDGPPAIAPSRPAPGFNWTGAYVGVQAGYGFGRKHWPDFDPDGRFDVRGWTAGATTGVNVQSGVFVAGVESEWLWTNIRGGNQTSVSSFGVTSTLDIATRLNWLSLNSVRAGFIPADRWLVYGKGGIAFAKETHDLSVSQVAPGLGSTSLTASGNALHTGWLGGVGVEYAFLGNWSAKLEYNYLNFRLQQVITSGIQNFNIPQTFVGNIANVQPIAVRNEIHLVKFGINYHFNSIADVVTAKY
jgi:opacity protein-like surface antigen